MDCPFNNKKWYYTLVTDGTEDGFYSFGSVWDYSEPFNTKSSRHYSYRIGRGLPEVIDEGGWLEPPLIEPCEYEQIIVRPRIKRNLVK